MELAFLCTANRVHSERAYGELVVVCKTKINRMLMIEAVMGMFVLPTENCCDLGRMPLIIIF